MEVIYSMTAGELGQIIGLSVGIGLSLYWSYKALQQTRDLRQSEYRHRLLKEIIDWSIEILELGKRTEVKSMIYVEKNKERKYAELTNVEIQQYLIAVKGRGTYIQEIAKKFWANLLKDVIKLLNDVEELIQCRILLGEALEDENRPGTIGIFKDETESVVKQQKAITKSAQVLMKNTVNVLEKELGSQNHINIE
jgi:hypothetical protein